MKDMIEKTTLCDICHDIVATKTRTKEHLKICVRIVDGERNHSTKYHDICKNCFSDMLRGAGISENALLPENETLKA